MAVSKTGNNSRWKVILRAWPPAGGVFVILSFLVTGFWLWQAITGWPSRELGWLEPLAAMLAGLGAFILAAILIFRRVDSARVQADTYGLARGLATGYYFNFVRPLVGAVRDPGHSLHAKMAALGDYRIAGLVVGIPQTVEDFSPTRHAALLQTLSEGPGNAFRLVDLEVKIPDRPRPIFTKLALSDAGRAAIIVDIPTTLAVIADFAEFFARHELEDAGAADEIVAEARKEIVAASETGQFREVLSEFLDVVNKVGSMESPRISPVLLLHAVPLSRLRRRMDELADH